MQWDKSERNTSEKSTFQTSPNWRTNLPRLEDVLFQGLGAWRIIFFYFRNHFLKIHTQRIPKMSDFSVLSHFWLRNWLSKQKKRVLTPSFPQPTSNKWVGEPDYLLTHHHQILTSTAFYWHNIIVYQPVLPHTDPVPCPKRLIFLSPLLWTQGESLKQFHKWK